MINTWSLLGANGFVLVAHLFSPVVLIKIVLIFKTIMKFWFFSSMEDTCQMWQLKKILRRPPKCFLFLKTCLHFFCQSLVVENYSVVAKTQSYCNNWVKINGCPWKLLVCKETLNNQALNSSWSWTFIGKKNRFGNFIFKNLKIDLAPNFGDIHCVLRHLVRPWDHMPFSHSSVVHVPVSTVYFIFISKSWQET